LLLVFSVVEMNKLVVVALLTFLASLTIIPLVYLHSRDAAQLTEQNNPPSSQSINPSATPTATQTASLDYDQLGSFGPSGFFRVNSPTSRTYNSSCIALNVSGETIVGRNIQLSMSYSLDGQARVPVTVNYSQMHDWDKLLGAFNQTIALPPLTCGSHSVTVYGILESTTLNPENKAAQVTINFTVQ
jgi:hypothetical protein